MFSIICGLILSETAFVIAIQVSDPLAFTCNIFQGFIISSPPCDNKVCTFCSKSPKISLKFNNLSFSPDMSSSTSHPLLPFYQVTPPSPSLPPLRQPKPLGTARFKRSEIVSKAASKRSFCVSCEARSQALPTRSMAWMAGMDAWGVFPAKMGGFHCPMKERTNYSSHLSRKVHHIILSWMLLDLGINHEDFWMEVIGLLFPDVFFQHLHGPWCQNQRKKVAGQRSFNAETYSNVWTEPWICLLQVVGKNHENIPQMVGRFNDDLPW